MKILVLMGSARKGKSYKVTQMVEQHMKKMGDVEFEYLFLIKSELKQCVGCHACIMIREESCPHKAVLMEIEEKIDKADGVIFVSPVFCQQVTALLKNFYDHMAFNWHRPRYFHKKVMMISSGGGQFKETLGHMVQNAKAWGCDVVCSLGVPHIDALTPKYRDKTLKNIEKKAKKFYFNVEKQEKLTPSIGRLLWFNMWKGNAIACKETIPEDYKYWNSKGWIEKEYYYDTKISIINKIIIFMFQKIGKIVMHRIYIGY